MSILQIQGAVNMGEVSVIYRILPADIEADVEVIAKKAVGIAETEKLKVRGYQVIDIAFGLRGLIINLVMPDTGGLSDKMEKLFNEIDNVQSVEVMDLSLV
jgi:translation elongation factor aEF-1 beta